MADEIGTGYSQRARATAMATGRTRTRRASATASSSPIRPRGPRRASAASASAAVHNSRVSSRKTSAATSMARAQHTCRIVSRLSWMHPHPHSINACNVRSIARLHGVAGVSGAWIALRSREGSFIWENADGAAVSYLFWERGVSLIFANLHLQTVFYSYYNSNS